MSESHFDEYEHYNYDQDKAMFSGHSGKQRSKKEAEQNTNRYSNPRLLLASCPNAIVIVNHDNYQIVA